AGVLTAQAMRTTLARQGTVLVRHGVKAVARTEMGKNAIHAIARASLGKSVSGAAAVNHVSKLLRTNVITGTVTTIAISTPDIYRAAVSKNTSWAQVGKNFVVNGVGVGAGFGGWAGGAALGATIGSAIPGAGTVVGGIIGGVLGSVGAGVAGSYASKKILDNFIQDDADEMQAILQKDVLPALGEDFLMSEAEFETFMQSIAPAIDLDFLRQMYAHDGRLARIEFAYEALEEQALDLIKARPPVILPSEEKVRQFIDEMIEAAEQAVEEGSSGDLAPEALPGNSQGEYEPNFVMVGDAAAVGKRGDLEAALADIPVASALLARKLLSGRY